MVNCTFKIKGEIKDFNRIDNVYASLKKQTQQLLEGWEIEIDVNFVERAGTVELPK
jgi:hypothetical protein